MTIITALLVWFALNLFVVFLGWRFSRIRARERREEQAERPRDQGAEVIYLARRIG